jgi:hypothetical protein
MIAAALPTPGSTARSALPMTTASLLTTGLTPSRSNA